MNFGAHMALGVLVYQDASAFFGAPTEPWLFIPAIIGSLLPDIDQPESQIGKHVPAISSTAKKFLGHRGVTHSLFALVMLTAAGFAAGGVVGQAVTALCWGYASHLLGDWLTVKGIPFFWPMPQKFKIPGVAFASGGKTEALLTIIMAVIIIKRAFLWLWP